MMKADVVHLKEASESAPEQWTWAKQFFECLDAADRDYKEQKKHSSADTFENDFTSALLSPMAYKALKTKSGDSWLPKLLALQGPMLTYFTLIEGEVLRIKRMSTATTSTTPEKPAKKAKKC